MLESELRQDIFDCLSIIDSAENADLVLRALTSFAGKFGFNSVLVGHLVNPANVLPEQRLMLVNWPAELVAARRAVTNVAIHDPIGRYALSTTRPFTWEEAYRHASLMGRRLMDQARDFSLGAGMMFPVRGWDSVPGGVSLGADQLDVSSREVAALDLVCQHAYSRLEQLLGPFPYQIRAELTDREIEVVYLAAAGFSNKEIAQRMLISPFSVRDYLVAISAKLETRNRAHTVAVAIARNLIAA